MKWLFLILCATVAQLATAAEPSAEPSPHDYLLGVYYFAGWWQNLPNKWETGGHDWRLEYPERIPLLGECNEQATMDREILAAAAHGVDFFQILWYPEGGLLNEGLRTFLASTNARRMRFTLEFVNHPPFGLTNDADWTTACQQWCRVMRHPSYLRLDGRPVFKVHGLDFFYRQNSDDSKRVTARLDTLRRIARENGLAHFRRRDARRSALAGPSRTVRFPDDIHGYAKPAATPGALSL